MLTVMVYLASPPLRRALGSVKLLTQKNTLNTLNHRTTVTHIDAASADRLNQPVR